VKVQVLVSTCHFISTFTDINECATSNGACQHNCSNTNGSYYCTCVDSARYILSKDGHNCVGKQHYAML